VQNVDYLLIQMSTLTYYEYKETVHIKLHTQCCS